MCNQILVLFCILLVLLAISQTSREFEFQFQKSNRNEENNVRAVKQRITDKKFKFHNIERVYVDNNDRGGYAKKNDKSIIAILDNQPLRPEDASKFKRVRSAHKVWRKTIPEGGQKVMKEKIADDNEEKPKFIFFTILNDLFSTEKYTYGNVEEENIFGKKNDDSEVFIKGTNGQSNGIINWLAWLAKKADYGVFAKPNHYLKSESWMSYFNRWPFNLFFPIGTPENPKHMPSHTTVQITSRESKTNYKTDELEHGINQGHFDSLLYSLPAFVVNASYVTDIDCQQQIQIFNRQLRGNKLWTLQMLDATAKITSGLLRGNINKFGDFELCMQVKSVVKVIPEVPIRIRGKYCLAHIEIKTGVSELKAPLHWVQGRGLWIGHLGNPSHFAPRYTIANWGICIPHLCSSAVVKKVIETNLRPYNSTGMEFHVEVNENDCYIRSNEKFGKLLRKDEKLAIAIFWICSLFTISIAILLFENWYLLKMFLQNKLIRPLWLLLKTNNNEVKDVLSIGVENIADEDISEKCPQNINLTSVKEKATLKFEYDIDGLKSLLRQVLQYFSLKRTVMELISVDRLDAKFPVLHLFKLSATFMLYICLKYLMLGHLPIANRDKLVRAVNQPTSVLFRCPMIYTDTLMLLSGFISAYQLSEEMEHKNYIQLLKHMSSKIARYLPTVYIVLFFQTWILPYLGSGPLWTNLVGKNSRLCEQQLWRNIFSVQNAIDFEDTCSPMTIQLALEVQLYILGPLVVWLYYTDADAAFFIYGILQAISVALRFARTQREHLSMTLFHGMNISKFYRTANLLYSSPITRATPFLLGIGTGIIYYSQNGCLQIAPKLVPVGWVATVLGILWCFWSQISGMRTDFTYTTSDAATYSAWCPLILGLTLSWAIFMFPKNDNSIVKSTLLSRPVLFMSRIAFPTQLVMYVVVLYNTARVKEARKYHITDLINFNEIVVIIFFAIILAFFIDIPSQNLRRLLINNIFTERDITANIYTKASETEVEHLIERNEHTINERIGSVDKMYSSDMEGEEQIYLTQRRNSATTVEDIFEKVSNDRFNSEDKEAKVITKESTINRSKTPSPPLEVAEKKAILYS